MKRKNHIIASSLVISLATLTFVSSCKNKEEEKSDIYIAHTEEKTADNNPVITGDNTINVEIEWVGYNCNIIRNHIADRIISGSNGSKYYDNKVDINITHGDEKVFSRTFKVSDFSSYIHDDNMESSGIILTSISYDQLVNGNASFIATISNPSSGTTAQVQISIDKQGGMMMFSVNGGECSSGTTDDELDDSQISGFPDQI